MNVWARLCPALQADEEIDFGPSASLSARLLISVYPDKESAETVAAERGGIVVELVAESLRGQNDSDVAIFPAQTENEAEAVGFPIKANINVEVPLRMIRRHVEEADGDYFEWTEQGDNWLAQIEAAAGVELSQ